MTLTVAEHLLLAIDEMPRTSEEMAEIIAWENPVIAVRKARQTMRSFVTAGWVFKVQVGSGRAAMWGITTAGREEAVKIRARKEEQ